MARPPVDPERRRRNRRRRLYVYGGLVLGLTAAYFWQPYDIDFVPRTPPNPNPPVNPDTSRLFAKRTRVLLVTAHPDDSEFYVGATLAQLGKTADIYQVILTDGDKGYYPFEDWQRNRRVREEEATRALHAWGGKGITFLHYPDGRLRYSDEAVGKLRAEIERLRPEYVLCFDGLYPPRVSHRDHRRSGDIALAAAQQSGIPKWCLLFSTLGPNYVFDATDLWDRKMELLAIHASQFAAKLDRVQNMVSASGEEDGNRIGVTLGEGFRCVRIAP